jgi:glycolate oxidase FAD binding subunit
MSHLGQALQDLEAIVGAARLTTATGGVATLTGGLTHYVVDGQMPFAVAEAANEDQVRGLLRVAGQSQLSVLLRGGGNHLHLGAVPEPIGLIVDLHRLDQVVGYDPGDLTITVQAGMSLGELRRLVGAHGQTLPLDPPGPDTATLGGIVATGLTGPLRRRYGAPRDLVLGLRVARSDGEAIKTGGRTVKNVAGYDLSKLFVGSFGTLGAILEVTLRLIPAPETRALFLTAATAARVREVTADLLASPLEIASCDVISANAAPRLQLGRLNAPEGSLLLLVGVMGAREAVVRQEHELRTRLPEGLMRVDGDEIWTQVRDLPYPTPRGGAVLRMSVPLASAVDLVDLVTSEPEWEAVARAGDGIVYALGPADHDTLVRLRAEAERRGGHAVLESGPLELKRTFPVWGESIANVDLMRALRHSFDPAGVMGCGRFVA